MNGKRVESMTCPCCPKLMSTWGMFFLKITGVAEETACYDSGRPPSV